MNYFNVTIPAGGSLQFPPSEVAGHTNYIDKQTFYPKRCSGTWYLFILHSPPLGTCKQLSLDRILLN